MSQKCYHIAMNPKDAYHHRICNQQLIQVYCTKCVHILKTITIPDFIRLVETVNYFSDMGFLQQLLLKTSVFQDGLLCRLVNYLLLTLILLTWRIWWAPNNASRWQIGFKSVFKRLSYQMECHTLILQSQYFINHDQSHQKGQVLNLCNKKLWNPNVAPNTKSCMVLRILLVNTEH